MDATLGYRSEDGDLYLPLEEISAGLGLAIRIDETMRNATGHYLSESNDFHLDLERGILTSAGQTHNVESSSVVEGEFDLYVPLRALNEWFKNMRFTFNPNDLHIEVISEPPLPRIQRLQREEARTWIGSSRLRQHELDLPDRVADYEILRSPVIDVSAMAAWSTQNRLSTSTSLRGTQDLLGLGTRWFVNIDRKFKLGNARVTLSRKDPRGKLLGFLPLTEIEAGDIVQPPSALTSRGLAGIGLRLTDRIKDRSRGSTIELRGELPEGWEAELYQNDVLTAFVEQPQEGQYVFADQALYAGTNEFKIVLYGPQGQRQERRETIRLRGNQPAAGQWYVDGSILLQDTKAAPVESWLYNEGPGRYGEDRDFGQLASEARVVYGVRPGMSLAATGSSMSLGGGRRYYAGLSAEVSPWGADVDFDSVVDQNGHWAAGGRVATQVSRLGLMFLYEAFQKGYRAPVNVNAGETQQDTISHRGELRLNGSFSPFGLPMNAIFRSQYQDYLAADAEMRFAFRTSLGTRVLRLNNSLEGLLTSKPWALRSLRGNFLISSRHRFLRLKADLQHSVMPKWRLTAVALSCDIVSRPSAAGLRLAVGHQFAGGTFLELGLGWTFPQVELVSALRYRPSTNGIAGQIGLRFSLDWLDGGAIPRIDHRAIASRGVARGHVFLDRDQNGVYSPGDQSLPGVHLEPDPGDEETDDNGFVTVSGLPELHPTPVTLQTDSLPDPFLRPTVPGYRVVVRPGAPVQLGFPVVWVSDVEGQVFVTEAQLAEPTSAPRMETRGLGNVEIVVLDRDGQEVRRVRSEFDGFFSITALPSGRYRLTMDRDQAARFGLDDNGGIDMSLKDDTAVLSGVELRLTKVAASNPNPR